MVITSQLFYYRDYLIKHEKVMIFVFIFYYNTYYQ